MKNTKYSIIIPYRDREEHLTYLLPSLMEHFKGKDYEIIVSEQADNDNFRISCVQNEAVKYANGEILIFHQVDYIPYKNVSYEVKDKPILPVKRAIFLDKDNKSLRHIQDIPGGYRNWHIEVDPNFYGGVICMSREHFNLINGFNPIYRGWGNEDEDLRERFKWANIQTHRNVEGTFHCLYHKDNGDMANKDPKDVEDFYRGRQYLYERAYNDRHIGFTNLTSDSEMCKTDNENVKWLKSTNFNIKY